MQKRNDRLKRERERERKAGDAPRKMRGARREKARDEVHDRSTVKMEGSERVDDDESEQKRGVCEESERGWECVSLPLRGWSTISFSVSAPLLWVPHWL